MSDNGKIGEGKQLIGDLSKILHELSDEEIGNFFKDGVMDDLLNSILDSTFQTNAVHVSPATTDKTVHWDSISLTVSTSSGIRRTHNPTRCTSVHMCLFGQTPGNAPEFLHTLRSDLCHQCCWDVSKVDRFHV